MKVVQFQYMVPVNRAVILSISCPARACSLLLLLLLLFLIACFMPLSVYRCCLA